MTFDENSNIQVKKRQKIDFHSSEDISYEEEDKNENKNKKDKIYKDEDDYMK